MRRGSTRRRLGIIGGVLAVAIAAATYLIIGMEREAYLDSYRRAAINLGTGMASQTDGMLAPIEATLRLLATQLSAMAGASAEPPQTVLGAPSVASVLIDAQSRQSLISDLEVVAADGMVVARSGAPSSADPDVSVDDAYHKLSGINDGVSAVGRPVQDPATGQWSLFLARRINAGSRFAGIVGCHLALDKLEEFYRGAMPPKRSVSVLRRDGTVLLRYPPHPEEIGRKLPDDNNWYSRAATGGGTFESINPFDNIPIIVFMRPLRNAPLLVDVFGTQSEALAEWYTQRLWVIGTGIAAELLMVALLRLFGAQVRRLEASEAALAIQNRQLEDARQQLDVALGNISQGLCFFGGDQTLILSNRRYGEIFQLPPEATAPGTSLSDVISHCRAHGAPETLGEALLTLTDATAPADRPRELMIEMNDGRAIAISVRSMPDGGWVATHEDITERRRVEAQIAFLARHDVLTGLANRALLEERIAQALAAKARGVGFALLFLDLDRFKAVNDNFGHPVGDHLLRAVAARLLACVREVDTAARLGGDEFVVLQVGLKAPADAEVLARRIIESLSQPYQINDHDVAIGVSIGVAIPTTAAPLPEVLIGNADVALYAAKQAGRGTYRVFGAAVPAEA